LNDFAKKWKERVERVAAELESKLRRTSAMNMDAQMTATIPPQDFDPIKQSSPPTPSLSPSLSFPNSSAEQESEHSQSSVILEATFPANAPTFERLLNSRKRNFDDVFVRSGFTCKSAFALLIRY
jgi:hypothetical protein